MFLAVHTTTTPAGLWAIVVVGVACLSFWVILVVLISGRNPRRGTGQALLPPAPRRPAESAEPGMVAQGTAVTRHDMPRVPAQRVAEPDRAVGHPGTGRTTATGAEIADLEAAAAAGRDRHV